MSKFFVWMILARLTGSPFGSLALLLVAYWAMDRFTLRVLPDPFQGFLRWQRASRLKHTLANNPNDRRARYELADIYVQQRRHQAAFELLRPNLEAGDDDPGTLLLLGIAARGSGQTDQAERILKAVIEDAPDYRLGAAYLELAQLKRSKQDWTGVIEILGPFLEKRRSSVQARVLLAEAKEKAGDPGSAKQLKSEAWSEYVGMPRHQRKAERLWAWRANPSRPMTYAAIGIVVMAVFATYVAPALEQVAGDSAAYEQPYEEPYED